MLCARNMRFLSRVLCAGLVVGLLCSTPAFAGDPGETGTWDEEETAADNLKKPDTAEDAVADRIKEIDAKIEELRERLNSIDPDDDNQANTLYAQIQELEKEKESLEKTKGTVVSGSMSSEELGTKLAAIIPTKLSNDNNMEKAKCIGESAGLIISALRQDGYTDAAIAGVVCNFAYESNLDPYLWEGYSSKRFMLYMSGEKTYTYGPIPRKAYGGCGLGQWTYERHKNLSDYCGTNEPDCVTITDSPWRSVYGQQTVSNENTRLGNSGTQIAFLIQENSWNGGNAANAGDVNIRSLADYKTVTDPELAARLWCACWETPGGWQTEMVGRSKEATPMMDLVASYTGGAANSRDSTSLAEQLVSAGYWTEEELSEYARLEELNIQAILDKANRNDLGGEDLEGLSWWERNVKEDKATGGVVGWIRKLVQFFGIAFIIWVIFIYMAYWFDRINNFFYIDMLGILTIGYLHMSDTEEECNFKLRDLGKGDRRTVNHKAILEVCLLGIFFGVFIVTGAYYKVIMWVIQFATRMFSKWF